jgi:hypothetical protein
MYFPDLNAVGRDQLPAKRLMVKAVNHQTGRKGREYADVRADRDLEGPCERSD